MANIDTFVNEWSGKGIDVDGFPAEQVMQCYDAFIQYNREVIGCQPTIICAWSGYVKDFWEHFNETILPQYYTQVGPLEKGQKGDVCIWDNAPATPYSHVAILLQDNGTTQHIFGQNQPNPYCTTIDFTSNGLLGYLRPKGENMPTYSEVLSQFRNFTGSDCTEVQMNYYVANDWGVLNGDLLKWVSDRNKEKDSTISGLTTQLTDEKTKDADLVNSLADVNTKLNDEIKKSTALQSQLDNKPTIPIATSTPPVNEQVVVQNWLVKLWNGFFNK